MSGRFDSADAARQSAAIDVLNASIPLKNPACVVERIPPTKQSRIPYPLFSIIATEQPELDWSQISLNLEQIPFSVLFNLRENTQS
jgi:hypothetical protein